MPEYFNIVVRDAYGSLPAGSLTKNGKLLEEKRFPIVGEYRGKKVTGCLVARQYKSLTSDEVFPEISFMGKIPGDMKRKILLHFCSNFGLQDCFDLLSS